MSTADIAIVLKEARKQERERCAKLAERVSTEQGMNGGDVYVATVIAQRIRKLKDRR